LKQALGDPWTDAAKTLTIGSVIEGPVVSLTKFGAFVQIAEGVEGMIHVSEISAEKRINHPQDVLKVGQTVKAQVLDVDGAKRTVRLSIKQMAPSSLDEYIAEHKEGDTVSGRVIDVSGGVARVELGEGVQALCRMAEDSPAREEKAPATKAADLSSLTSMLQQRWKSGASPISARPDASSTGQVRSFRIAKLDPASKKIELELAKK
jgi:small subunit ribosomal protein S1